MGSLSPSSPSGNPNPPPSLLSEHHNPPPSPPSPHRQPSPPSVDWSFDQSWGSIETATHLSPIPTYSWEDTDSMSTVVPETQFSMNPSMSSLPPLSPSVDLSFDSTLESIETTSAADLSPISIVIPETPPTEGGGGYIEEEKRILRFLAIQCPCVLLFL